MRFSSLAISAVTAIAVGHVPLAIADESPQPSAAGGSAAEQVVVSPGGTGAGQPDVGSVVVDVTPVSYGTVLAEGAVPPSEMPTAPVEMQPSVVAQLKDAVPASRLGEAVSVDAQSLAKCPLKTELVAYTPEQLAQVGSTSTGPCPRPEAFVPLVMPEPFEAYASPALSIYIPVGFGLDGWGVWGSGGFQAGVREDTGSVGGGGFGVALGDAKELVGLELGYTIIDSDAFGEGGFSGKLHRRIGDNLSIAFGWNGFGNIGRNDFEQSIYGVATYVFHLAESLDSPFSRLAVSVGAGNGQFRTNYDRDAFRNGTGVFGNAVLRIIRPVSLIAEWTSQDLAVGLSIAPFKNVPFVITPAVRDVTGSGYAPRFVLGAGFSFKF